MNNVRGGYVFERFRTEGYNFAESQCVALDSDSSFLPIYPANLFQKFTGHTNYVTKIS